MTYYFDMDGVLANFHKEPFKRGNALSYNFMVNLDPFMETIKLVKSLIKKGEKVYISSLAACEDAKRAKIDWLAKYLPEIKEENIIIIIGNGKKHENMKTEDGILVDDKKANCTAWEKAGHKAIFVETRGVVTLEV